MSKKKGDGLKSFNKGFQVPDTYIIIFFVVVIAAVMTFLVPKGYYETQDVTYMMNGVEKTRTVIKDGSFQYLRDDAGKVVTGTNADNMGKTFKPDMNLSHNKYVDAIYYGRPGASYSGNTTIETTELQKEFGKYVNSERLEILQSLMGKTESTQYMPPSLPIKWRFVHNRQQLIRYYSSLLPIGRPKEKLNLLRLPLRISNVRSTLPSFHLM